MHYLTATGLPWPTRDCKMQRASYPEFLVEPTLWSASSTRIGVSGSDVISLAVAVKALIGG
jgi:hypothetical protein